MRLLAGYKRHTCSHVHTGVDICEKDLPMSSILFSVRTVLVVRPVRTVLRLVLPLAGGWSRG